MSPETAAFASEDHDFTVEWPWVLARIVSERANLRHIVGISDTIQKKAYRDKVYHPETEHKGIAEIIIGKQRNGPIGFIRLVFIGKYTRFENLAPGSYNFDDDA
jgi:replicative DNA helicase